MPTYHSSLTAAGAGAALPKWAPKFSGVIAAAAPELLDWAKPGSVQLLSSVTVLKSENGSKCIQLNAARIVCNISMTMICLQPTVFSAGALIKSCFPVEQEKNLATSECTVHGFLTIGWRQRCWQARLLLLKLLHRCAMDPDRLWVFPKRFHSFVR